ncbi:hypothetical protein WKI71_32555 [Streptomyces sp. MS1.AVA.1]|uniref:Uncharacterized protein n=1 Tax=Streptomyces machairae TaxID=3134109 RepID=A0ABU8UR72_9ACTN
MPRPLAAELAEGLPSGTVQIIDLDEPEWADPEGLLRHAQAALSPEFGAPELPFTVDPAARLALGAAIGRRAGTSPLVVQLAVNCILMAPEGFDPADERFLPTSVGEALDLHARRLGTDSRTLRLLLAPLALAEADGLPIQLWARLASAVAGQDMSQAIAGGMLLAGPFVQPEEQDAADDEQVDGRTLLRLLHPAISDEIRAGLPNVAAAQSQIAMALLEAVPEQDWGRPTPTYATTSRATRWKRGLLPQLLTDPGPSRPRRSGAVARRHRGGTDRGAGRPRPHVPAYGTPSDPHRGARHAARSPAGDRVRRGRPARVRRGDTPAARAGTAVADAVEPFSARRQRRDGRQPASP